MRMKHGKEVERLNIATLRKGIWIAVRIAGQVKRFNTQILRSYAYPKESYSDVRRIPDTKS